MKKREYLLYDSDIEKIIDSLPHPDRVINKILEWPISNYLGPLVIDDSHDNVIFPTLRFKKVKTENGTVWNLIEPDPSVCPSNKKQNVND